MNPIARIYTDFPTKFGIPRQSDMVESLKGTIVFEPEYRNAEALRGIEDFSHIWLIWEFSEVIRDGWSPTVRPPRLGGNTRMGVFATRSPFRPNPIGLSVVKLDKVDLHTEQGPVLHVSGVDMMNGTPVFDIKPYIPYTDSHPDAVGGFTDTLKEKRLNVIFPENLQYRFPAEKRQTIIELLSLDPRPSYQNDAARVYGFSFAGFDIRFSVSGNVLTVKDVIPLNMTGKLPF